jgi:hypothetical protein
LGYIDQTWTYNSSLEKRIRDDDLALFINDSELHQSYIILRLIYTLGSVKLVDLAIVRWGEVVHPSYPCVRQQQFASSITTGSSY